MNREVIADWLRDIAVWSPNHHWASLEERIPVYVDCLMLRGYPAEAFSAETVRLVASKWETFPPYAVIHEALAGYRSAS